jgi:hypothetical protein
MSRGKPNTPITNLIVNGVPMSGRMEIRNGNKRWRISKSRSVSQVEICAPVSRPELERSLSDPRFDAVFECSLPVVSSRRHPDLNVIDPETVRPSDITPPLTSSNP